MRLSCFFLILFFSMVAACDNVRAAKRPGWDVVQAGGARQVAAPPHHDDCELEKRDGQCTLDVDGQFKVTATCPNAPPPETEVARFFVCMRLGAHEELRKRACRAGGDTIVELYVMTDSCIEEDLDGVRGTGMGEFVVYRTR